MTRIGCLQKTVAAEKRGSATDRDPSASAALLAGAAAPQTAHSLSPTSQIPSRISWVNARYSVKIESILMDLNEIKKFNQFQLLY